MRWDALEEVEVSICGDGQLLAYHGYSESRVRAYRPEAVLSDLADGSRIPALCFNLIVPPGPDEGNSEYAGKLRDLARRLGLPSDYVEGIQ